MLNSVLCYIHFLTSQSSALPMVLAITLVLWLLLTSRHSLLLRLLTLFPPLTRSPEYHTSLSLHISATFTMHSSVQLLDFGLSCDLIPVLSLMRFLFVRPEVCLHTFLQIPPRGGHPWCSAIPFPLSGRFGTFTL